MKRIISFILALSMIFSLGITAFADVTYSADKNSIKKGETVAVTINNGEKMENITSFEYRLYFDSELFELKSSEIGTANTIVKVTSVAKEDTKGTYYGVSLVDATSEGLEVAEGVIATLVFEAIKEVETASEASFELVKKSVMDTSWSEIEAGNVSGNGVSITVAPESVEVTGITLNKETLYLGIGEADILKATVLPENATDKTVVWSSSAEGVATVDQNGNVTAVAAGTATITAKTGEFEATCEVTVMGNKINVNDDVVDITDYTVGSVSSYYGKATGIKVEGVTVKAAYENGKTVYIVVSVDTADGANINTTFQTSTNRFNVEGVSGAIDFTDGCNLSQKLVAKYNGSFERGNITYNLVFIKDELPTEVPSVIMEADSKEVYQYNKLEIDLSAYFIKAYTYYLIEGETETAIEKGKYSVNTQTAGEQTLVFAAENNIGRSEKNVTVTVNVKEVEGGIYIGKTTSNGSLDTVSFKDGNGNYLEGATFVYDETGKKIEVVLPQTFDLNGKITAEFSLTQNSSSLPFVSSSNAFNQGVKGSPYSITTTLSSGKANQVFYYYNTAPKATNNNPETYTIVYKIFNNIPVLAENVSESVSATATAGNDYKVNLEGIFTDKDNDALTYEVKVDGGNWAAVSGTEYVYSNDVPGTYALTFRANDGKDYSEKTHTVNLTLENNTETYTTSVVVPEGVEAKFYITNGFENGTDVIGEELSAEKTGNTYTVTVPANISKISFRSGNMGMAFDVTAEGSVSLRKTSVSAKDLAEKALEITSAVKYGENNAAGENNSYLLVEGIEYVFTATPNDSNYGAKSVTETIPSGEEEYKVEVVLDYKNAFTFTVTEGATAKIFKYNKYYDFTNIPVLASKDNENGTVTYYFNVDTKANQAAYVYYAFMEGKITKAGWLKWGSTSLNINFTESDYSADARFDYSVENGSYLVKGIEEDNVLLNVNAQNALNLSVGGTKTLKGYRAWEIIPVSYNNHIITPNFHFNVVWESEEGVVSLEDKVSPSAGNGNDWQTLKAKKEGLAIIEVTYDAIQVDGGSYDGYYGATDPARSGLVVVQVGGTKANVNFGIDGKSSQGSLIYESNTKKNWDAEFDTLYFTEDSGEIKLSPSSEETITEVAVSGNKGASWTVINAENGVYTAPIVHGNNIIRITTDKGIAYQVVRGYKVTVTVSEQTGDGDGVIEPGETARVTFKGLHQPIPKMAGNYNPGYRGNTDGDGGTHVSFMLNGSRVSGAKSQYAFVSSANYIDIVIPEEDAKSEYVLSEGCIATGVIGLTTFADGGDSHRNIPDAGCATRGDKTTYHTRAVLPDVTIEVAVESEVHEHSFIKEVADEKYFISAADCEKPAVYKVSCECGEAGTETFEYGEALGHKDENKDHVCDNNCGIAQGEHADTDKDHACDYGCSVAIGFCEDADKDHACDYGCGKAYGEHEDTDKDHDCDYGCSVAIGTCEDANKDHACDYGCDKTYGTHEDTNKDHNCDYGCSVAIGTCEDADKDHACDYGCDKTYGTHEDTDKDHDCDYGCSVNIGTCEDANKDHACDYGCGKAYGEHKDSADDKDHVCDYGCRAVLEECSGGVANCTEKATCSVCGEKYGEIDSDAHAWTVSYDWSKDGKACTATKACANNAEHNLTAEATVTSVVAKEANCSVMGDTQYTATFAADWAETQVTVRTDIAIDEDAHEWGEWKVVREATYKEKGLKERECNICEDKENDDIPKLTKPSKPSKPSDKPNPGITIITPEDEKEEANPNTGAPVFDMTFAGVVVLAATAIVLGKKNK